MVKLGLNQSLFKSKVQILDELMQKSEGEDGERERVHTRVSMREGKKTSSEGIYSYVLISTGQNHQVWKAQYEEYSTVSKERKGKPLWQSPDADGRRPHSAKRPPAPLTCSRGPSTSLSETSR